MQDPTDRKLTCVTLLSFCNISCDLTSQGPTSSHLGICCLHIYAGWYYVKVCGCYLVVFHVLQLLPIRFPQQNLCYINKSMMNHWQKVDSNFPRFSYGYQSACMFVDCLIEYIGPPNYVHYWVWIATKTWRWSPIYVRHVSLWYFVLQSPPNHTPKKYRCPSKKCNWIAPASLILLAAQDSIILPLAGLDDWRVHP